MRARNTRRLTLVLALAALAAAPQTTDRWAAGAHDPHWDVLAALQAYPAKTARFDWEALAGDGDPLVRTAAVAALGRDAGARPALLASLVDDPADLVRKTALWALLQRANAEEGRAALLSALERIDEPLFLAGGLFWRVGLPPGLGMQDGRERREWLQRFDGRHWKARPTSCANALGYGSEGVRVWLSADSSEWDADAAVSVRAQVQGSPCGDVELRLDGLWQEIDLTGTPSAERGAESRPASPRLRAVDGDDKLRVRRGQGSVFGLSLSGDPGVRPGVYLLRGFPSANPLLFRVRRTTTFEQALPSLLKRGVEPGMLVRLGQQRVRAAGPRLLDLWSAPETQAGTRYEDSQRRDEILRALARTEDPDVAARVLPKLLSDFVPEPYRRPWEAHSPIGAWGETARPYVERFILDWRAILAGHRERQLAALVGWPGFPSGSAVDRARVELAQLLAPGHQDRGYRAQLLAAVVEALVPTRPDVALDAVKACLRAPNGWLIAPQPRFDSRQWRTPSEVRRLLEALWEDVRDDPTVSSEQRAGLAYRLAETGERPAGVETMVPASVAQARAWLAPSDRPSASQQRFAAEAVQRFLRDRDDAALGGALATLWLRLGEPSRAAEVAERALQGLSDPAEVASANLVLGHAAAILGRAATAERALQIALDAPKGGPSNNNARLDAESDLLALRVVNRVPGLVLRIVPMFAQGPQGSGGPTGGLLFGVAQGRVVSFDPASGRQEVFAAPPWPVQAIAPLDRDRVVVADPEGQVALYERGKAGPRWHRRLVRRSTVMLAAGHSAVLVGGYDKRVDALDPANGRSLWSRTDAGLWRGGPGPTAPPGTLVLIQRPADYTKSGATLLVDERTGVVRWSLAAYPAALTANRDLLVLSPQQGAEVRALGFATGAVKWTVARPAPPSHEHNKPTALAAAADGSLVYVATGHVVQARDARTGALRWERGCEPPRLLTGHAFRSAESVTLAAVPGGVLAAYLWPMSSSGRDVADRRIRDLILLTDAGEVVFQETRRGPSVSAESGVQVEGSEFLLEHAGIVGRSAIEVWGLADVPRRGRRAPRPASRPPGLSGLTPSPTGLVGEVDGIAVRVAPGVLEMRSVDQDSGVRLAVAATSTGTACEFDPVPLRGGRPVPSAPLPLVRCLGVRPGVDFLLADLGARTEVLWQLAAGQDPRELGFRLEGIDQLRSDEDGGLRGDTALGPLHLFPALAAQEINATPFPVTARFVLRAGGSLHVEVGAHDVRKPLTLQIEAVLER